jgi:hypothetical protein
MIEEDFPALHQGALAAAMDAVDDVLQWRESARHTDDPDVLTNGFPDRDYEEIATAAIRAYQKIAKTCPKCGKPVIDFGSERAGVPTCNSINEPDCWIKTSMSPFSTFEDALEGKPSRG